MNDRTTFAAPAALATDDQDDVEPTGAADDATLDELCEHLAYWCRTRRYYGSPRLPPSLLGRLRSPTRAMRPGPDAPCSADLAALYLALLGQPIDALDRQVFELHYFHRVSNVKVAALELGIGRQHWYTLLRQFRRRIHAASKDILAHNEAQRAMLPSNALRP